MRAQSQPFEPINALRKRADSNAESVVELINALKIIRDNTTDPAIYQVADEALRMPWLGECA